MGDAPSLLVRSLLRVTFTVGIHSISGPVSAAASPSTESSLMPIEGMSSSSLILNLLSANSLACVSSSSFMSASGSSLMTGSLRQILLSTSSSISSWGSEVSGSTSAATLVSVSSTSPGSVSATSVTSATPAVGDSRSSSPLSSVLSPPLLSRPLLTFSRHLPNRPLCLFSPVGEPVLFFLGERLIFSLDRSVSPSVVSVPTAPPSSAADSSSLRDFRSRLFSFSLFISVSTASGDRFRVCSTNCLTRSLSADRRVLCLSFFSFFSGFSLFSVGSDLSCL
mmetsp:Transcript_41262/g.64485  ORF Transcript_41262/g.64485 Transcript_41262/m.64485 type:complete len:280 (-) Transcript_41262:1329-2168(-)